MTILRLSHVELRVPDLELATAYYSEVVGMIETGRDSDRVFLKCWDEQQHHSVVLTMEPTHGLNHFGFKVTDAEDLDHYQAGSRLRVSWSVATPRTSGRPGTGARSASGCPAATRWSSSTGCSRWATSFRRRTHRRVRWDWSASLRPGSTTCSSPRRRSTPTPGSSPSTSTSDSPSRCWVTTASRSPAGSRCPTARTTSPSSPGPTAGCTTSRTGSTAGTTCAAPPTSASITG